jgi:cyanophycinase
MTTAGDASPGGRDDEVGTLALVGGAEWQPGADFDAELLARSDGDVVVLPTAAAYEHPERAIATATVWFASLGARVAPCMLLQRSDSSDPRIVESIASARFVYLGGGSPLHLRSVLKDSDALGALVRAWRSGAVVAASSAGAMVLTDPMLDPRGGAFTVGFGLVRGLAVVPHFGGEVTPQLRRTLMLAPMGCAIVALPERSALVREPDGTWRTAGEGAAGAAVFLGAQRADLTALAGKSLGP